MITAAKIGILGGGQLGTMLVRHAIDYGLEVYILDSSAEASSARYTRNFTCGDPAAYDDVIAFGTGLDVITIEKENVNTKALRVLQQQGVKVHPSPDVIEIIQDKLTQKRFLESHNIPVVPGISIENKAELHQYEDKLPGCLKQRRDGYDGYGVMVLHTAADIEKAFNEPSVLEELVEIEQEIAVIVSRNEVGAIECYDPVAMVFNKERFVLDYQLCPAGISEAHAVEARDLSIKIAEALGLVGILAVEMFITKDGKLLVNELAPRPHNSGHHTIEGCTTSQFEQLLRAAIGLPLGETKLKNSSVMINVLEPQAAGLADMEQALRSVLGMGAVHLHWYGKKSGRPGRKIGHITITDDSTENVIKKAETVRKILKNTHE